MPKTLNWLHISDLHLCEPLTGWDANRVLRTLIEDLAHMKDEYQLHPDFIFFTGDVVFGHIGDADGRRITDQFRTAAEFFEKVRQIFDPDITKENLFFVPGNHDVNRSLVLAADTDWLDEQQDEYPITKTLREADTRWQSFFKRLTDYRNFLETNGYAHLLSAPGHFHFATVRPVRGLKVGIAGLNSAWACCRDKEKGKLWIGGKWQIETVLAALSEAEMRIALIHHPPGWFVPQEDNQFAKQVKLDFDFHLHGHEHESWVDASANGHTRIAAGAGYESSNLENGYNFVQLDLSAGTGRVWLRKYERKGGAWVPEILGNDLTDENGCWRLSRITRGTASLSARTGQISDVETTAREKLSQAVKRIFAMQDRKTKGIKVSTLDPESAPQAWTTAQALVGILRMPDRDRYQAEIRAALDYIESSRKSRESGWALFGKTDSTVTEIGSWAVLATIESAAPKAIWSPKQIENEIADRVVRTLDYLGKRQFDDGGCCPTRELHVKNTRTYTTAMALWAWARGAAVKSLGIGGRYVANIGSAVRWLLNNYVPSRGWVPNPNRRGQTQHYLGLQAQVLFILLETEPYCEVLAGDPLFQKIKEEFLSLDDFRTRDYAENANLSSADQPLCGTNYRIEGSTYLWCPWALAALNSLAANATLPAEDREKALRLKRQVMSKLLPVIDEREEMWELAECLFGLACVSASPFSTSTSEPRTIRWSKTELVEIYSKHPLQEKTILERLRRQGKDLAALSEFDLAVDDETELTDQNHIGGVQFTEQLAELAQITSTTRVLDIGSGLGGTARVIANLCHCPVQGIELTRSRHNDAISLTRRVQMGDQIQFVCGDFMTEVLPENAYDVIVAQSTLAHFPDKKAVLGRCARLLKSTGRLAVEDVYLTDSAMTDRKLEQLRALENSWKAYLVPLSEWLDQSRDNSFFVVANQDLTPAFIDYHSNLLRKVACVPQGTLTDLEIQGWKHGLALAKAGTIVYNRTIVKKL